MDQDLAAARPEHILARMLSTNSYLTNTSRDDIGQHTSTEIVKGQCGTMYSLSGTTNIAKLPNLPEKVAELLTDFKMHCRITEAVNKVKTTDTLKMDINISELRLCMSPIAKDYWRYWGVPLRDNVDAHQNFALVSERVFPVPLLVREALVDVLCPPVIQKCKEKFLSRAENKNLLRIYLSCGQITKIETKPQNVRL